ncbi:hypothetical protein STEG23_019368, partial [Scotinomys teguina]
NPIDHCPGCFSSKNSWFCDSGHVTSKPSYHSVMVPTKNTPSPELHCGFLAPSSEGSQLYVCKLRELRANEAPRLVPS